MYIKRVRYTDFFQEKPRNLRFLTKILANCVVEDVSKFKVSLSVGKTKHRGSFFFLDCKLILRLLLILQILVALRGQALLLPPLFVMSTKPSSVNTASVSESFHDVISEHNQAFVLIFSSDSTFLK